MATVTLELPPHDLGRLLRTPALLSRRRGRVRTTRASIVWHDTADGRLAQEGVSLSQGANLVSRTQWRLERLRPDGQLD